MSVVSGGELADKNTSSLTIKILHIEGLELTTKDIKYSVRLDYRGSALGESPNSSVMGDGKLNVDTSITYRISANLQGNLFYLCNFPFVLSLYQHKLKVRKQKQGKPTIVSQGVFECSALFKEPYRTKLKLPLHPISAVDQVESRVFAFCELFLENVAHLDDLNFMAISIDSMQSLPENLQLKNHEGFTCALSVDLQAQGEPQLMFERGALRVVADSEYLEPLWRWYNPGSATGFCQFIPESVHQSKLNLDEESGDFCSTSDYRFRYDALNEKPKVVWNQTAKVLLLSDSVCNLRKQIADRKVLPIEIIRTKAATSVHQHGQHIYDYHGVAYVNMVPLLYPGTTKIAGAYRVVPFEEEEYVAKTKLKKSLFSDMSPGQQAAQKKTVQKADRKNIKSSIDELNQLVEEKERSTRRKTSKAEASLTAPTISQESQEYVDAQTFIVLQIELERPLVAKRTMEEVDQAIHSYITAKETKPSPVESAAQAVSEYHKHIEEVARYILVEIKEIFAELIEKDQLPVDSESVEKLKNELYHSINASGKYFAFKEHLKHAVIRIVREKMFRTTPFCNEAQLQSFFRDLFVFLIDEMHVGLRSVFNLRRKAPTASEITISDELILRMARESRSLGDSKWAIRYYGELVARNPNSSAYWIEFAAFYLGQGEPEKAEVCLHRVLRIDQSHPTALLLCGLIAAMQERVTEATDYLESAVIHAGTDPMMWVILGVFNETLSNDVGAQAAFLEASRLDGTVTLDQEEGSESIEAASNPIPDAVERAASLVSKETVQSVPIAQEKAYLQAANFLLEHHAYTFVPAVLAHEVIRQRRAITAWRTRCQSLMTSTASVEDASPKVLDTEPELSVAEVLELPDALKQRIIDYHLACARLHIFGPYADHSKAQQELIRVTEFSIESVDGWSLLGQLSYMSGEYHTAKGHFERCMLLTTWPPKDQHLILLRLGSLYLQSEQFQQAKDVFLVACKESPTALTWFGVGVACYRLDELEIAEEALTEANYLNNQDPKIWAYLSLICLKTGRKVEAELTYKYAIKTHLQEQSLLDELHSLQTELGFGNPLAFQHGLIQSTL